jgi:hypothetical protein
MEERKQVIADIVRDGAPMSVRHAFYAAVGAGISIPKNSSGYSKVQRVILELRRNGEIGYNDIVDGTRRVRQTWQVDSLGDVESQQTLDGSSSPDV